MSRPRPHAVQSAALAPVQSRDPARAWKAAGLVLITVLAYLPAFRAGFVWDDDSYLLGNRSLRSAEGLGTIWSGPGVTGQYYPVVFTSFWAEYHLWGYWPAGYHAVNVLLHAANAVLFWLVLVRLGVPGALLAAAVFALHPVNVESVAWISERKNVLSGLFYLLAAWAYLRFAFPEESAVRPARRGTFYALALGAFVCALLSKTSACTLPATLLIVLWWKRSKLRWSDLLALLPMFALAVGAGILTASVEKSHSIGATQELSLTLAQRLGVAGAALWFYVGKLLAPYPLVPIYPRWEIAPWWPLLLALAVGVAAALWLLRGRLGKWPLAAFAIFVVGHAPTLGFVDFAYMLHSWVADHFQYLPGMAMIAAACALAVGLVDRSGPRVRRAGWGAGIVVLAVLGTLTWSQSRLYEGRERFFQYVLAENPTNAAAEIEIGLEQESRGDLASAIIHYRRAIELRPNYALAHATLGFALGQKGELDESLQSIHKALELQPKEAYAYHRLGVVLGKKGDWAGAIEQERTALRLDVELSPAHDALCFDFVRVGRPDLALTSGKEAVRLEPQMASYHLNYADALAAANRPAEAAEQYRQTLQLDPKNAEACFAMGMMANRSHREDEAAALFRQALTLRPGWGEAMSNLAMILATAQSPTLRNPGEASALAGEACRLAHNGNPWFLASLAAAQAAGGNYEQAARTVSQAIAVAQAAGQQPLAAMLAKHLALYEAGKPLAPPAGAPAGSPGR